jgi:chromosome segregation ATPase
MEFPSEGVNLFDSVINDIQSIQTRYENMVTSLNLRLRKITNDHQKQMMQIEYHESKIAELQKQSEQYEALVQENVQLKDRCSQQSNEIEELKQTIQNME